MISAFDDGVRNAPADAKAYLARARRLAELERFDEAEADFNKALELAPENAEALVARARFHAERGDVEHARADFDAALRLVRTGRSTASLLTVELELGRHAAVLAAGGNLWGGRLGVSRSI